MRKKDPTVCNVDGCKNEGYVKYYNKYVCRQHFEKGCDSGFNLKKALRIKINPIKSNLSKDKQTRLKCR